MFKTFNFEKNRPVVTFGHYSKGCCFRAYSCALVGSPGCPLLHVECLNGAWVLECFSGLVVPWVLDQTWWCPPAMDLGDDRVIWEGNQRIKCLIWMIANDGLKC